jgi:hypothetical protein
MFPPLDSQRGQVFGGNRPPTLSKGDFDLIRAAHNDKARLANVNGGYEAWPWDAIEPTQSQVAITNLHVASLATRGTPEKQPRMIGPGGRTVVQDDINSRCFATLRTFNVSQF